MSHIIPDDKSIYQRILPKECIEFISSEGKRLLTESIQNGDAEAFFPLIAQFETQSDPAYCGLASLTTVLNALQVDPHRLWKHPWRWFADSLFECCVDLEKVKVSGTTMDEVANIARHEGVSVAIFRNVDVDNARRLVLDSVRGKDNGEFEFLVSAYDRATLQQSGEGHFSPIAAYHAGSDRVLILDVARFKYGPHWIPLRTLIEATKPFDESSGLPRGFLLFRRNEVGQIGKLLKIEKIESIDTDSAASSESETSKIVMEDCSKAYILPRKRERGSRPMRKASTLAAKKIRQLL